MFFVVPVFSVLVLRISLQSAQLCWAQSDRQRHGQNRAERAPTQLDLRGETREVKSQAGWLDQGAASITLHFGCLGCTESCQIKVYFNMVTQKKRTCSNQSTFIYIYELCTIELVSNTNSNAPPTLFQIAHQAAEDKKEC